MDCKTCNRSERLRRDKLDESTEEEKHRRKRSVALQDKDASRSARFG